MSSLKKMEIKKEIREGEMIPKYYGVAYRNMDRLTAICYPIPLNIVLALWNRFYIWLRWRHGLYDTAYHKGWGKGFDNGRKYAFEQYREQVKRQEIRSIVENFIGFEEEILKEERDGKDISGWIYRFIDRETKRISL